MSSEDGAEPVQILENVFLGDKFMAKNKNALLRRGITHVVNCTEARSEGGVHNFFEGQPGFNYMRVPVQDSDGADLSPFFEASSRFIDEGLAAGYSVLIHCQQGISRSPTVLIAWLLRRKRMTLMEAYSLVRSKRPEAKPKANFLKQLVQLEKALKDGTVSANADAASTGSSKKRSRGPVGPALPPHLAAAAAAAAAASAAPAAAVSAAPSPGPDDSGSEAARSSVEPREQPMQPQQALPAPSTNVTPCPSPGAAMDGVDGASVSSVGDARERAVAADAAAGNGVAAAAAAAAAPQAAAAKKQRVMGAELPPHMRPQA